MSTYSGKRSAMSSIMLHEDSSDGTIFVTPGELLCKVSIRVRAHRSYVDAAIVLNHEQLTTLAEYFTKWVAVESGQHCREIESDGAQGREDNQ